MKTKNFLLILALAFAARVATAQECNVVGSVLCEGRPVAGAVVSDGEKVTTTDAEGRYGLVSSKNTGYVFLSIPSGYEVEADGLIPRHFVPLKGDAVDRADFELRKVDNRRYTLFVLNDIHLTNTVAQQDIKQFHEKFVPDFRETLRTTPGKLYGLTLGDMTTDSRWYRNNFGLPEYLGEMAKVPCIPLFHCMGNHDNDPAGKHSEKEWDSVAVKTYRRVIGPNYYSFNLGEVHYVMLDNIVYRGPRKVDGKTRWDYYIYIDDVQLAWLEQDLSYVKRSTPLVVCMHAPLFRCVGLENGEQQLRPKFSTPEDAERLLEKLEGFKQVYVLTGHSHVNDFFRYSKHLLEHNNVAVAASSWKLYGEGRRHHAKDGTPGGYAIYEVDGKKISWKYKALGRPVDSCQFIAFDMNTVPERFGGREGGNEVLVNVYNWDPEWKITVRENGRKLPVERCLARDPLYSLIADGIIPFESSNAFTPSYKATHMFRVTASGPDTPLEITVRDRFGRKWREVVERPKAFHWQMR